MRSNINIILPIILSLLLPGLYLYSNVGVYVPPRLGFFGAWVFGSITLSLLWYIIRYFLFGMPGKFQWWFWGVVSVYVLSLIILQVQFELFGTVDLKMHQVVRPMLAALLFLSIQYALKAQEDISRLQLEKEQMQTENYKVQLKALRSQIDPHFLFNSLNTLRSMVRHQHSHSEQFVMSLSDFYRQTLKHNENTTLPLSEELRVLESYLFVMKNRNEEAVDIHIKVDKSVCAYHIPTLALQVVVENCFKHNSMTSRFPLKIEISSVEGGKIRVCNNLQPKIQEEESSGFGLELLKKRYALMNIDHGLSVEKLEDQFCVTLTLIKQ